MAESALHRLSRLLVNGSLAASGAAALDREQTHHVGRVLRLRAGDPVRVFNGADGEWLARIEALDRQGGTVGLERQLRAQATPTGPDLVFALVKKPALDLIVEKAVELGVSRLRPVRTRFGQVGGFNLERARSHVRGATQQCERLDLAVVEAPVDLPELLAGWPREKPLIVAAEAGAAEPAAPVLGRLAGGPVPGLLVGPEGGFDDSELDALRVLPFVHAVRLGPRVLRAETASIALLAVWQAIAGDWQDHPRFRG